MNKMNKKIYTLKTSLNKKIFRTLEIRGDSTLYKLANAIIKSFNFDMDHAFGFYDNIKKPYHSDETYELFVDMDESRKNEKGVKKTILSDVFTKNKKMAFVFDYGDEWIFLVECKDITDPIEKTRYPRVIEKVGQPPAQYPDYYF
jgi:hypothetical protein